jgi:hypothetical protein
MNEEKKLELKVEGLREAFRERIALLTDEYENRIVDLRVQLTGLAEQASSLSTENEELNQRIATLEEAAAADNDTDAKSPGYPD